MAEELWGVRNQDGNILPVIHTDRVQVMKLAAKHVYKKGGNMAIGKLVSSGCQLVKVKIVEA